MGGEGGERERRREIERERERRERERERERGRVVVGGGGRGSKIGGRSERISYACEGVCFSFPIREGHTRLR